MEKNEEIRGISQIWRCRRKRLVLKASSEILFLENKHPRHVPVFFIFKLLSKKSISEDPPLAAGRLRNLQISPDLRYLLEF